MEDNSLIQASKTSNYTVRDKNILNRMNNKFNIAEKNKLEEQEKYTLPKLQHRNRKNANLNKKNQ